MIHEQCRRGTKLDSKIAICHAVQRVARGPVKPERSGRGVSVDGERCARQSCGTER